MSWIKSVTAGLHRLGQDRSGAAAVLVAVSLLPLSVATVGALDLERGVAAKSQLQDALDAAALAASRATPNDAALLQTIGAQALARNLGPSPALELQSAGVFSFGDKGSVVADASATIDTVLAQALMGHPLTVAAHAEVARSDIQLEIALALDNTGSMAQSGKIQALRAAAGSFIDTLSAAAEQRGDPEAVKISLVPFSQTVRVDPSYRNAAWIDAKGQAPINDELFDQHVQRLKLFDQLGVAWAGCLESRAAPYDVQDTPPSNGEAATLFTPYFAPDEPDIGYTVNNYLPDQTNDSDWKVRERYARKYKVKASGVSNAFGPNANCQLQPIRRLSSDYAALKADVASMVAVGDTNIPIGLVWAWHTLSPNAPFADGASYSDSRHKKIAVLMTDGYNQFTYFPTANQSLYSGAGYVWQGRILQASGARLTGGSNDLRTAAMDSRLGLLCSNMKATGIEIFAVAVGVLPEHQAALQACASDADHYYDVANAAGIGAAFQGIAAQIVNLHLSR
jgi:Flp pilus assembly protein TadG